MFTNTVLDVAVLVLPMPIIWRLQIPRKQKIVISGIFLLGSLYNPFRYSADGRYR